MSLQPGAPASRDDHEAAALLDANERALLDTQRARAKNWLGILSAITALVAATLTLKGPDAAGDLPVGYRIWVTGVLIAGLVFLAWSTFLAYQAAYGDPSKIAAVDRGKLPGLAQRLLDAQRSLADTSANDLRGALFLLCLGALLVGSGTVMTWFPPRDGSAPTGTCISVDGKVIARLPGDSVTVGELTAGATIAPCPK